MKKILALSILLIGITVLATAETITLPNYEKEAEVGRRISCDNNKTNITSYDKTAPVGDRYYVEVTKTESGTTLYLLSREKERKDYLFIQLPGSEPREISGKEFHEKMKALAPESYKDLASLPNDCRDVK